VDERDDELPEALARAEELYEEDRVEEALEVLVQAGLDDPDAWSLEALARADLGDLAGARRLVARLEARPDFARDPRARWAAARLALREWRTVDAERLLRALAAEEPDAAVLDELALCADLRGDAREADRLLREAARLAGMASPPRLDGDAFEEVVREALERLPEPFRAALERVEIVVEPMPAADLVDLSDPADTPPDLLGLFVGASALEIEEDGDLLPPRIFLFQRNLERASADRDELVEEIRVTLYHEIAHLLGFDEEGVAGIGLE
jgi:predicted Zn-dependent protease with MMP-like domain